MASLVNLPGLLNLVTGVWPWADASDIRARLLMTNTTADTQNNIATLSAYSDIDTFDGVGTTNNMAMSSFAGSVNSGSNRVELDAADIAWGALANGTRQIQGCLLFVFVTNDADSVPIVFVQFSSSINPAGGSVTIVWDATGILRFS